MAQLAVQPPLLLEPTQLGGEPGRENGIAAEIADDLPAIQAVAQLVDHALPPLLGTDAALSAERNAVRGGQLKIGERTHGSRWAAPRLGRRIGAPPGQVGLGA
jgi:hypothetical protein